jgi:hypothetical protein
MLVDQVEHIMEKRVLAGDTTLLENHINIQETQPKNEQKTKEGAFILFGVIADEECSQACQLPIEYEGAKLVSF